MDNNKQIPTLSKYMFNLKPPVWVLNPQTPVEASDAWYREQEEKYYKTFGRERIESTRRQKEGE